jgi:hypothetical protein
MNGLWIGPAVLTGFFLFLWAATSLDRLVATLGFVRLIRQAADADHTYVAVRPAVVGVSHQPTRGLRTASL